MWDLQQLRSDQGGRLANWSSVPGSVLSVHVRDRFQERPPHSTPTDPFPPSPSFIFFFPEIDPTMSSEAGVAPSTTPAAAAMAAVESGTSATATSNLELSPEISLSISIMQKGSFLCKVRPNKLYRRTYFLSEDMTSLRWEPSKKRFEESKFLVSDIKRVLIVSFFFSFIFFIHLLEMIGGKWFASTSTLSSPYPIGNVHRWNKKEKREELCTPIFIFHFFSFSFSFFLFFFHSLSKPSIHLKIFFILNRARRLLRSPTQWKMWRSWWTCRFLWYLPTQRQNPLTSSQRPSRTSSRGPWASSTSSLPSLLVWTRWRQAHSWARSSSLFLLSLFRSFRLLFEWVTPRSKLNLRVLLVLHGSSCLHYCGVNSWLLLAFIGETKEIVLADILPVRWLFHHSLGAIKERRARAHCSWGNQVHSHWPAHFRLSQGFVTIFFTFFPFPILSFP